MTYYEYKNNIFYVIMNDVSDMLLRKFFPIVTGERRNYSYKTIDENTPISIFSLAFKTGQDECNMSIIKHTLWEKRVDSSIKNWGKGIWGQWYIIETTTL